MNENLERLKVTKIAKLSELCERFAINDDEYQNAKTSNIERIMEFSGIDDAYRAGIVISKDNHMNYCHPNIIDIDTVRSHRR